MKVSQLLLVLSVLYGSAVGSVGAQTLFTLSVASKGTFEFDPAYPARGSVNHPFNFHRTFGPPHKGEAINYFVFKPSEDVFKSMRLMSRESLFSRIEPCSGGIDKVLSDRAQAIGGELSPVFGRTELLPYLKREEFIHFDGYIYVPIESNLRNYVKSGSEFGSEWVPVAVRKKQVCLYVGVGRTGYGALASRPINISRLADFVFLD
ncbi:MAG: hypothetical protein AB1440_21215 [Pseudomonadota bacterium]